MNWGDTLGRVQPSRSVLPGIDPLYYSTKDIDIMAVTYRNLQKDTKWPGGNYGTKKNVLAQIGSTSDQ